MSDLEDEEEIVELDEESAKINPLDKYKGEKITSVLKAIRAKCLDCSETNAEVKHCVVYACNLYPFRLGKNPYRAKRVMTEEQRGAIRNRLENARKQRTV